MISIDEALARISGAFRPLPPERIGIVEAAGRVLAADVVASFEQPPAAMSAMDGYAVRAADAQAGAELAIIGASPAGHPFAGRVCAGEAVRILTGGIIPEGADAVVIQEDTVSLPPNPALSSRGGEGGFSRIRVTEQPRPNDNIRPPGLDFRNGDVLLNRGHRISARDLALIASADIAEIAVTRKPRVAVVATGDELSRPGERRKAGGIVASSTYALQAMVAAWGGEAIDVGIFPDKTEAFATLAERTRGADLIVTQGGASVGDHDLVQSALAPHGFTLDFWKIAMRPGKPLIFGRLKETPLLGLPGNPVSAMVCAVLFLRPTIAAMLGTAYAPAIASARLSTPLGPNGKRQDFVRTKLIRERGELVAQPFVLQDSSMQRVFAKADGLIIRKIDAPAASAGDTVDVLLLEGC
jgi:molybdopterin molybdotransferase